MLTNIIIVKWFGAATSCKYNKVLYKTWFEKYDKESYSKVKMYFKECESESVRALVYFSFLHNSTRNTGLCM